MNLIETNLVKVAPLTSIEDTIAQMHQEQTDRAFVVDGERLVGIFSGTNLLQAIAEKLDLGTVAIERVMSPSPVVLELRDSDWEPEGFLGLYRRAIDLVRQHQLRYLPVVDTQGCSGCSIGAIESSQLLALPLPSQPPQGETASQLRQLVGELERRIGQRTAALQESHDLLIEEIRDRLLAELEVSKLESQFRVAVDNLPNIFAIYDRHRQYQFVNSKGLQYSGKSLEELVGFRDEEIFTEDVTSSYLPLLESAVATRTPQTRECQIRNAQISGTIAAVVTYVPLLDDRGEIYQILGIANDITEQKQSEAELIAATDRLRAVLDAVPGFVSWIVRHPHPSDGAAESILCYEGVNTHLAASLNRSTEAFVGQPLGFMEGQSQFTEFIVEFMDRGARSASRTIDVNIRDARCSYLIAAQKYQQDTAAVAVGIDITERKLAQQERQLAYQRSQLLSEVTLKIRQSLELEEILQTAVEELQKLLAASRVAIFELESPTTGRVVKEAVLPGWPTLAGPEIDDPSFYTDDPEGVNLGYAIADIEEAHREKDRDLSLLRGYGVKAAVVVPIWVSGAGTMPAGEDASPVLWGFSIAHQCDRPRAWMAFEIELLQQLADQMGIAISIAQLIDNLEDIVAQRTAQLRAVNQNLEREIRDRRRAEIALRRSEQQLRLTADALPVAIAYVDAQQVYRFNNRTYEDWLGKPLSQITGYPLGEVLGDPIYQSCRDYIETALSGSRVTYETQQPQINGISRYLSVTYIPDISETGEVKGYFGVEIDISDRHAVEQMKDEFLSVASHELRTPLTSIRGSLGLLATGKLGDLEPKGQRMLEIALKNTDRLCRLINDILDLERMESGQIQVLLETCNAVELMFQAAEAMQAMAESAGVTLHAIWGDRTFEIQNGEGRPMDFDRDSIPVWVDADRILQTLINLISNAIKFSPPQETISIGVTQEAGEVCFQVSDRGRGIPYEQLDSIFGRFQQVDASDSRQKGGTGLGLAICLSIVRQHGGRIWAESVLGVGSRFYVTLPLLPPKTSD